MKQWRSGIEHGGYNRGDVHTVDLWIRIARRKDHVRIKLLSMRKVGGEGNNANADRGRNMTIEVTPKQNEYLIELEKGPKTSHDFGATVATADKMLRKLRAAGLINSTQMQGRGNQLEHSLTKPYPELLKKGLIVSKKTTGHIISEEEILYIAILRNAGMTGRELRDQHSKVYPHRVGKKIGNIVDKARHEGLCR